MENSINISTNAYLFLNTQSWLFFQTATKNLQYCSTSSTMQDESAEQRGNGIVLESAAFEIRKP